MADDKISQELDRLTSDGCGYGDPQAQLLDDRKFQMLMNAYKTAVETRKLEIELFWSRSLFFWGLIASGFVAYATLRRFDSDISAVVACFGFVCSIAWSLGNRGSKFWQESWETKVERIEPSVTGAMFSRPESVQAHKNFWLRGRKFSVSKLAIALSDYTIVFWLAVITWELLRLWTPAAISGHMKPLAVTVFVSLSFIYGIVILFAGHSTENNNRKGEQTPMEDEKRTVLVFPCPNCNGMASPMYTKGELETAIEEGELSVSHIMCFHSWKIKLTPQHKINLRKALDNGLLFS